MKLTLLVDCSTNKISMLLFKLFLFLFINLYVRDVFAVFLFVIVGLTRLPFPFLALRGVGDIMDFRVAVEVDCASAFGGWSSLPGLILVVAFGGDSTFTRHGERKGRDYGRQKAKCVVALFVFLC
jgi:hypothetical protein